MACKGGGGEGASCYVCCCGGEVPHALVDGHRSQQLLREHVDRNQASAEPEAGAVCNRRLSLVVARAAGGAGEIGSEPVPCSRVACA